MAGDKDSDDVFAATAETGVDRIRSLFKRRYGDPVPDELKEWSATVLTASVVGFLFGGFIGARMAGDKYILMNHNTKYIHPMQAQRELHSASMLGFVGNGSRLGWKICVFAAIFSGCKILMSVYRDKEDGLNYVTAGAVAGCAFRVRYGLKPAVGGMVLGTLLSIPVGCVMYGMHGLESLLSGKEQRGTRCDARRERDRIWQERLRATDSVISDMQGEIQAPNTQGSGLSSHYTVNRNKES